MVSRLVTDKSKNEPNLYTERLIYKTFDFPPTTELDILSAVKLTAFKSDSLQNNVCWIESNGRYSTLI